MTAKDEGNPPVIVASFAAREVRQGETWKIYLQAQDPDGDMNRIVCLLEGPGIGQQPVTFIKIPDHQRRNLSGYILLKTGSAYGFNFSNFLLTVQIQNKKGFLSRAVSFPLSLNPRANPEGNPPRTFQDEELGSIAIPFISTPGP